MEEELDKPEYFYRLICLVVDLGTEVLLQIFKHEIKVSIESFLKSKESEIKELKKRKILNDKQLETLNEANVDETKLDISLLYTLLRNLAGIQGPNNGWNACPLPSDKSPGALLIKLKDVRNEAIAHRAKGSLKKSEFEKFWKEASLCLVELAGGISSNEKLAVQNKVDNCKTQPLLREDEFKFDALLKWEFEERCSVLESKLDVLDDKVSKQGCVTEDMMSSLIEIQDHMKKLSVGGDSTGTSSLVKPSPLTSVCREQDIKIGQLKQLIGQMQRQMDELISQKTWYFHPAWGLPVMMGEPHPTIEDPIVNPNALTADEIIEYSEELGSDWEIFAIYLGYKQSQIDRLKDTYPRQIESLLRAMIQKWHDVVAHRDENPKQLLAAAFIRNRDNRTAVKILGNRELLTEVKKLKPKDETAKLIHKITFGCSSGTTFINMPPGSAINNSGTISTPSPSFGQTHRYYPYQTPYNMGQQGGHQQAQPSIGLATGYGHTPPYSDNPHNMCRGEAVGDEMDVSNSSLYKKTQDDTLSQIVVDTLSECMKCVGCLVVPSLGRVRGTVFRAGDRYVITASHVLERITDKMYGESLPSNDQVPAVFINFNEDPTIPPRTVYTVKPPCFIDKQLDVAILEISNPDNFLPRCLKLSKTDGPKSSVSCIGYGHPGSNAKHLDPKCCVLTVNSERVLQCEIHFWRKIQEIKKGLTLNGKDPERANEAFTGYDDPSCFLLDSFFEHGGSGGPAIDHSNSYSAMVVGIYTKGFPSFFFDLPLNMQYGYDKVNRFEMCTKTSSLYSMLVSQNPELAQNIFG